MIPRAHPGDDEGTPLATPRSLDPPDERERTTAEIRRLADEIRPIDTAVALILGRLADALAERRSDEARAYAGALEPRAIAQILVNRRSAIWSALEVARNVVIFSPIAVTWYGLSTASVAYAALLTKDPELVGLPFLLLWQESFRGVGSVISFSTLAIIDAGLDVDPSTVLDWIHAGSLSAVKLGPKTYRIPLAVVLRQLDPEATKPTRVRIAARAELKADEHRRARRAVAAR